MPLAVADTSFLVSLYGNDAHTAAARSWVSRSGAPVSVSLLGQFEFRNALRFAAYRRVISPDEAQASLTAMESDLRDGHLQTASCDLAILIREASRLSERHTLNGGYRSFDILHVAAARQLKATTFLSFDANQRKLAAAAHVPVGP